jgi:hypothetical protein
MAPKTKKQVEQITLNELINEELSTRTDTLKTLNEEFKVLDDISNLFNENIKANKKQAEVIGDIVDATKSVLEMDKDITEETLTHTDLHKLERRMIREGVQDTGQIINKLKEKQEVQKRVNNVINRQASMYKAIGDSIENAIKRIPVIGGLLSDVFGATGLGDEMNQAFRTMIQQQSNSPDGFRAFLSGASEEAAGSFANSLIYDPSLGAEKGGGGRGGGFASQRVLRNLLSGPILALAGLGAAFGVALAGGLESMTFTAKLKRVFAKGAFDGLNEAFGTIDRATIRNLGGIRLLGLRFGIAASESAKVLQVQTELSGITDKQARTIQTQISRFAKLRGVLPKDIIADIANNTELFAKFAKDGGMNIGLAAVQAKELGLSLSTVENISTSLLDFQSSIEGELKASLLIGRQLNLNKARELALAGDLAGLQQEIVRQVGSEAELNRLNIIQRKELAQALGITVQELGRLAGGEVDLGSADIRNNTEAMDRLTQALIAATIAGGGRIMSRFGGAEGRIADNLRAIGFGGGLATGASRIVGGAGMLLGGAGVVLTLVSLTRALIAAVRDGNENTKQMVQNSKGKQFSPFTEGLT